jgi:drug/metabolite transporter (DMT)-like permease
VIAAYPLVTVLGSAIFLPNETLNRRIIGGAVITVTAIAWLATYRTN